MYAIAYLCQGHFMLILCMYMRISLALLFYENQIGEPNLCVCCVCAHIYVCVCGVYIYIHIYIYIHTYIYPCNIQMTLS
jgi:hypothetical protein